MEGANKAISLTNYLISLPDTKYLVLSIFIIGFLFGIFMHGLNLIPAVRDGFLILSLPAFISSILFKLLSKSSPLKHVLATALAGEVIYLFAYTINVLLPSESVLAQLSLFIGASLVFLFWYLIARFVFLLKYRSILFSFIQLFVYLFFLVTNQFLIEGSFIDLAPRFILPSLVLFLSFTLFLFIINAPMVRNFGIRSTDALSYFFSQWLYQKKDMESAFDKVGEAAKTVVGLATIKRSGKKDLLLVVPYFHFGPFGNLGSSEFTSESIKYLSNNFGVDSVVFHGPSTHDLNLVSSKEFSSVFSSIEQLYKNASDFSNKAYFSSAKYEEATCSVLSLEKGAFVSFSRAPLVTEDISLGLGLFLTSESDKRFSNAIVADEHNAETGEVTSFESGELTGFNYYSALCKVDKKRFKKLKVGFSSGHSSLDSIGEGGIRVILFDSICCYVVLDSNGIIPEIKEQLEKTISEYLKLPVRIFTTDTHAVNTVRGVLNPVDSVDVLEEVLDLIKRAKEDVSPAKMAISKAWVDVKVIGALHSAELIGTVNSIIAISKIVLPLLLLGAIAVATALLKIL